jgi:hypothetical protein
MSYATNQQPCSRNENQYCSFVLCQFLFITPPFFLFSFSC